MNLPDNVELGLFGCVGALFMSLPISVAVGSYLDALPTSALVRSDSSVIWAFIRIGCCLSYVLSVALSFSYGLFEKTGGCSKTHGVVSTDHSSSCEGLGVWKHSKPLEWRSKCLGGFVMCQSDHLRLVCIALQRFVILECTPAISELVLLQEQSIMSSSYGWKAVNTKRWKEGEILKYQWQ